MIPWGLYNLTPRDQASPLIRPYNSRLVSTSAGATALTNTHTIPDEQILLVTSINVWQEDQTNSENAEILVLDPSGTQSLWGAFKARAATDPVELMLSQSGNPLLVLHAGDTISCTVRITTAAVTWFCHSCVSGVLLPRGTVDTSLTT